MFPIQKQTKYVVIPKIEEHFECPEERNGPVYTVRLQIIIH